MGERQGRSEETVVRLRPMRAEEYPVLIGHTEADYARDMEALAGVEQEIAQRRAREAMASVLPNGLRTPGHALFVIEEDGQPVGRLWLAEREGGAARVLYVYEIAVDAAHRGRGLGRAAMQLAEEQARARGIRRLELNVFGDNEIARGLYRSLGYREMAVQMAKVLD